MLALLVAIDTTVGTREPDGKDTVDRLHQLSGRWRPQDTALLDDYAARLQRWTLAAAELLGPEPKVFLQMPARTRRKCFYCNNIARDGRSLIPAPRGCLADVCVASRGGDR